jgi:aromatic amino acid aminotransferase I
MKDPQINTNERPIDLSHHLSTEARNRVANPLKDILRVISECPVTDLISMANGNLTVIAMNAAKRLPFR